MKQSILASKYLLLCFFMFSLSACVKDSLDDVTPEETQQEEEEQEEKIDENREKYQANRTCYKVFANINLKNESENILNYLHSEMI